MLRGQQRGDLLAVLIDEVPDAEHDVGPLRQRRRAPRGKAAVAAATAASTSSTEAKSTSCLPAGGRIVDGPLAAGRAVDDLPPIQCVIRPVSGASGQDRARLCDLCHGIRPFRSVSARSGGRGSSFPSPRYSLGSCATGRCARLRERSLAEKPGNVPRPILLVRLPSTPTTGAPCAAHRRRARRTSGRRPGRTTGLPWRVTPPARPIPCDDDPVPDLWHRKPRPRSVLPGCGFALCRPDAPAGREIRKLVTSCSPTSPARPPRRAARPGDLAGASRPLLRGDARIIEVHGGTVEKFIGDAVMGPRDPGLHEDDALRAVRAAAAIRVSSRARHQCVGAGHRLDLPDRHHYRGGLRRDPTSGQAFVTGDAVNAAARLEQAARPGEILLGAPPSARPRRGHCRPVEPIEARASRIRSSLPPHRGRSGAGRSRPPARHAPRRPRARARRTASTRSSGLRPERSCQLFTLLGPAGVGKSRPGRRVRGGRRPTTPPSCAAVACPYGEGISFWPLREIIRTAARHRRDRRARRSARPKLRALYEGERDGDLLTERVAGAIGLSDRDSPQEETFWAIRRLVDHVARERPLVVVIEDVHWAHPDRARPDRACRRPPVATPRCCCSVPPARSCSTRVRHGAAASTMPPPCCSSRSGTDATDRLIAALPGGTAPATRDRGSCRSGRGGQPALRRGAARDHGRRRLPARDRRWHVAGRRRPRRRPHPALDRRAPRGPPRAASAPDERAVAERASVVGRVFEQAAVTELATEALRPRGRAHRCWRLVRKELIRPERSELGRRRGLQVPPHPHPRRRVRGDPEGRAGAASTSASPTGWSGRSAERPGRRVRVDRRLPPRAGVPLSGRARGTTGHTPDRSPTAPSPSSHRQDAPPAIGGDVQAAVSLLQTCCRTCPHQATQRIELLIDLRSALSDGGSSARPQTAADAEVVGWLAEHPDEGPGASSLAG